ncbi:MAG: hypothetical protein K2I70_01235 [Bacilli bacterium]|nr:hypothetical protein [Bacilli bacterium]
MRNIPFWLNQHIPVSSKWKSFHGIFEGLFDFNRSTGRNIEGDSHRVVLTG